MCSSCRSERLILLAGTVLLLSWPMAHEQKSQMPHPINSSKGPIMCSFPSAMRMACPMWGLFLLSGPQNKDKVEETCRCPIKEK